MKNARLSSMQSQPIKDFKTVKDNYIKALNTFLDKCPNYWGGYSLLHIILNFGKVMIIELIKEEFLQCMKIIGRCIIYNLNN